MGLKSASRQHSLVGHVGVLLEGRRSGRGCPGVSGGPSGLSENWNWMVPDSTCLTCRRAESRDGQATGVLYHPPHTPRRPWVPRL